MVIFTNVVLKGNAQAYQSEEQLSDTDSTFTFTPQFKWIGHCFDLDSLSYQAPLRHTGTTKPCQHQFAHLSVQICQLAVPSYSFN